MFGRIKSVFYNYLQQKNSLHLKNTNVDIMPFIRKNNNARAVRAIDSKKSVRMSGCRKYLQSFLHKKS